MLFSIFPCQNSSSSGSPLITQHPRKLGPFQQSWPIHLALSSQTHHIVHLIYNFFDVLTFRFFLHLLHIISFIWGVWLSWVDVLHWNHRWRICSYLNGWHHPTIWDRRLKYRVIRWHIPRSHWRGNNGSTRMRGCCISLTMVQSSRILPFKLSLTRFFAGFWKFTMAKQLYIHA